MRSELSGGSVIPVETGTDPTNARHVSLASELVQKNMGGSIELRVP